MPSELDPRLLKNGSPDVGAEPAGLMDAVKRVFGTQGPQAPAPGPYTLTDQQCVQLLADTRGFCETGRELFEFGWWRNLLYLLGRQWIYWNPTSRQWNDKRLAKWVPKPVTNMIRTAGVSIKSILADISLSTRVRPNGNTPVNLLTAQTADDLEPEIQTEHQMKRVMSEADFWAIYLGNAYLHPCWDKTDTAHVDTVQLDECQLCHQTYGPDQIVEAGQKCPACGSKDLAPAVDPATGQPQTQQMVIGKGKTLVVSPLELLLPLYAQKFEDVDRLIYLTWRPKHEIEDELGPEIIAKVATDAGPQTRSLQLFRALATTSDLQMSPSSWSSGGGAAQGTMTGCTEQHLWIKPCKKFPQGFYMRFLGEGSPIPIRDRPTPDLPYKDKDGAPLWSWIHYPYETFSGRLYAQSAVDVIMQKQDQLNQIDSLTQMTIQRMGNPIWLEPKGAEVERLTGEPGLVVKWQPTGANGAKPERIPGENPPQSFFVVREQYKADAEELSGTYDVLKGAKPSGVEAYSALNLLVERSQSRFSGLFQARGEAYRQWYVQALELERQYGPTSRVKSTLGPNKSWTFQLFKRADLGGSVTILVEDGSNAPKTALGRRAAVEHLRQILPGFGQTPEQQYALYNEFGLQSLAPSLDSDVKSALQEQQAFEDWAAAGFDGGPAACPLIRMPWHNDPIHLSENRKWMNSDAIREILAKVGPAASVVVGLLSTHLEAHATMLMHATAAPGDGKASGAGPGSGTGAPGGGGGTPSSPGGSPSQASGAGRGMQNSNTNAGTPPAPQGAAGAAA